MLRLSPQRLPQRYAALGCAAAGKFKNNSKSNRAAKGKSFVCGVWWPALALEGGCGRGHVRLRPLTDASAGGRATDAGGRLPVRQ